MKINELIKSQPEVIKFLQNSKNKGKLVHAYMFEGDSGSGLYEAAKYFAMMLLCDKNEPCLECDVCRRVEQDSHINVSCVEPNGDYIKKDQIEKLKYDFSMSSIESGAIIYIIKDADKLNIAAANALLKLLEEPLPNHYAILLTNNHNKILDTIVSRCVLLHFKPATQATLIQEIKKLGANLDLAYLISNITSDKSETRKFIEEGKLQLVLNLAKRCASSPYKHRDMHVDYFTQKKVLDNNDKSWQWIFLDSLILIYQEIAKKLNNQETVYFNDVINLVKPDVRVEQIIKSLDIISRYEERLNYNVNIDLLYTSLFVELQEVLCQK